jgi:hypothetical protein
VISTGVAFSGPDGCVAVGAVVAEGAAVAVPAAVEVGAAVEDALGGDSGRAPSCASPGFFGRLLRERTTGSAATFDAAHHGRT